MFPVLLLWFSWIREIVHFCFFIPTRGHHGSESPVESRSQRHPKNHDWTVDTTDKIRKYGVDYNNNPVNVISFMTGITSTSGRIHSEFVRLLFLQVHRETDRFFSVSGVQSVYSNSGLIYYRCVTFFSHLKSKIVDILTQVETLRIMLNIRIDVVPVHTTHCMRDV